jgi:adenosylmethionine-8-amino-7-oxononanoate aminotransferase
MDCISSWWTNLFGHANPRINAAIQEQMGRIEHVMLAGLTHPPVVELSEQLSALTQHHLGHAFYASDGASAVEIAMKMSHHFWRQTGQPQKNEFICLASSYHGETLGALSLTDVPLFRASYESLIKGVHTVMSPDARQAQGQETPDDVAKRAAQALGELLELRAQHISALIVEPRVQCAGHMAMHSPLYLQLARDLCDQHGVHLIADEIAVGCGRTGTFFACESAQIWPDFLTLSKGISAGYLPLSIVLCTDTVYDAFLSDQMAQGFLHSHSYSGNPLACSAALAALAIFESDHILANNLQLSRSLEAAFRWTQSDDRLVHQRQTGLIVAFDLHPQCAHDHPEFSSRMHHHALEQGLLIRPIGETVYVMPPYVITEGEIEWMSKGIERALNLSLKR